MNSQEHFYMILIMSVSLTLVLSATLSSTGLHGYDIYQEFSIFAQVSKEGVWHPETYTNYNTALSISILPAMLSAVSGIDGISVFTLVFPVVFSLAPVILYKVYEKIVSPRGAFLSVFLFMSYPSFYIEMVQLGRQEIAEVLLILLIAIFFSPKILATHSGTVVIVLLTMGLVMAHYSTAYIYFFVAALSFLMARISRKISALGNLDLVMLSAAIVLSWYLFVASGSAWDSLINFGSSVVKGFIVDFFNPASRPMVILEALGTAPVTSGLVHDLNRVIQYLVQISLVVGLIALIFKQRKTPAERRALPIMTAGLGLLACGVLLPFFAARLNLSRLYQISLLFASPCLVYAGAAVRLPRWPYLATARTLAHKVKKSKLILAASILMLYFLFISGWVWAVTGDVPTSRILDRERMMTSSDLTFRLAHYEEDSIPQDVAAAVWLKANLLGEPSVCSDYVAREHALSPYGGFAYKGPLLPSDCDFSNSYVYISTFNVYEGVGFADLASTFPVSSISAQLANENRICSTGGATIYS